MKIFCLTILFLICIGCQPKIKKNEENTNHENINRHWMLVKFKDYSKEYLTQKEAFLDLKTNRAVSKMGCNTISSEFDLKSESKIAFSKIVATRMACTEMQLEEDFVKTLALITSYKMNGHQLILFNKNGDKMVFIAQDWD